jgi:AraC family transcriptional regulator
MKIVGLAERFSTSNRAAIPRLWERANASFGDKMAGIETFGVCSDVRSSSFQYLVGIQSDGTDDAACPDHVRIPAKHYAIFQHLGHISSIAGTWSAIFDDWLPGAGRDLDLGPEFERYAPDFDPRKPGGVSIWMPVKRC